MSWHNTTKEEEEEQAKSKSAASVSVCVCVCARVREREVKTAGNIESRKQEQAHNNRHTFHTFNTLDKTLTKTMLKIVNAVQ